MNNCFSAWQKQLLYVAKKYLSDKIFFLPYSCFCEFNFLNEVFSLSRNFANLIPDSQLLNCVELSKHKTLIKSVEGFADDDLFSEKD